MMGRRFFVVIDMQNDFVDPDGALPVANAEKVRNYIKWYIRLKLTADDYVIFTRDTHVAKYYNDTQEGRKLPILHCVRDSWGWEVDETLFNTANCEVGSAHVLCLNKNTFGTTDLGLVLNQLGIKPTDDIEICGVCTDICVVSNALILHTQFPGSTITCNADMCAGSSIKAHKAALKVMESCQIEVLNNG